MKHKDNFRVDEDARLDLQRRPTRVKPAYHTPEHCRALLDERVAELRELQELLYADKRFALLVVFQGMDASGKDGAIEHVMSGVNPQGCRVYSFGQPSAEEQRHDFLWRCLRHLPERGHIAVFNRSYYEEVLVTRVHPELLDAQRVAKGDRGKAFWKERHHAIRAMERHLHMSGTRVIKFFLHVSLDEQRKRLLQRLDDPRKNWKFNAMDLQERALWPKYLDAYEDCLRETSRRHAPWHVIPADDKENARLMISQVLMDSLKKLKLAYPELDAGLRRRLPALRRQLLG